MYAPRSYSAARSFARTSTLAIALSFTLAACAATGAESSLTPTPEAITFENTTNGVVRVYLVSASNEWLLGRVQPAETAKLRLPPGFSTSPHEQLALSVVPIGTVATGGLRATGRSGVIISPDYPLHQLLSMRWGVAGAQLYGVLR